MKRFIIQIARIRLGDVRPGDVINLRPDSEHGWFPVERIRQLPSGDLIATGSNSADNVKATPWDLVGIQVAKPIELPPGSAAAVRDVDVRLPSHHDGDAADRMPSTSRS